MVPGSRSTSAQPHLRVVNADFIKLFLGFHFFMLNMSVFNLLPHYLELRGASQSMYGAVAGTMGVVNVSCILLLGYRGDHWSRKVTVFFYLTVGMLGNAVAILAMREAMEWYFLSRAFQGMMMALGLPIIFSWVIEVCPTDKKREVIAWIGIAGLVANSLGPLLAELILSLQPGPVDADSYRTVFIMAAGLQGLSLAFFLITRNSRAAPDGERTRVGLFSIMLRRESLSILVVALAFGGSFGVFISFGKNYAVSVGLSYVSVLFLAFTGGAIVSRFFISPLTSILTPSHMITLGLMGVGFSIFLLGRADAYPLLGLVGLLYGLSHGILYPTLVVRFIESQGPSEIGRATILVQGAFSGGWGLFPYLGGLVVQFSSFTTLFSLLPLVAGGAVLLHLRTERRRRRGLMPS